MMRRETFRNAAEKPWARIAVLAVALILVAVLLYRQVQRFRGDLEVWVAASDLAPGAEVTKTNLKAIRVRESEVPGTVLRDKSAIEGKRLARAKRAGTPFFRADFVPPDQGPGLAGIVPEGRVLVFLPLKGLPLAELVEQLRFGDRFDIVAFGALRTGGQGAVPLVHDAFFVGWVAERPAAAGDKKASGLGGQIADALASSTGQGGGGGAAQSPLLLAVHPWEAMPLAEAQASGAPLSLVLHGRSEVEKGKVLTLPMPRFGEVEVITGDKREKITLPGSAPPP
ncbi:MAG TPA: SAF domain-containing protein [Thermoanaerobaculia bacterium]|jgi:hypothetical protein|nr:SAF domain-containing protein [Thermoanaerobaculia bacterium]